MPDFGRMRHRVTFQRETVEVADDLGNVRAGTWTTLVEVWAHFAPERSRERIEAGRLEDAVMGTLTVRRTAATAAVTSADRARYRGETYNIRTIVNPDQKGRFLEMQVERGVAT